MLRMKRSYKKPYGIIALIAFAAILSSCAPYQAHKGTAYFKQRGKASWYGPGFAGRKTANGERFNPNKLTAAHKKLPFNTTLRVTNLANGKSVVVRINDRGPFVGRRIIDLSKAAAKKIDLIATGTAMVEIETLTSKKADIAIAKKSSPQKSDVAPKPSGLMLAARGPVRKNGVAHLIEVDNAKQPPVKEEAPAIEALEKNIDEVQSEPVAEKQAPVPISKSSAIEDRFVVTSAKQSSPPKQKSAPKPSLEQEVPQTPTDTATVEDDYAVDKDDF